MVSMTANHSCKIIHHDICGSLTVSLPRTGKLLHAYGNVKASTGELDESFEFHSRALQQYKSTIGMNHHRTADLCVKVSDHSVRFEEYEAAR